MPRVKIAHAYGVIVEVEASEASVTELRAAAREEFERAVKVTEGMDPGPAGGLTTETRWVPGARGHARRLRPRRLRARQG